MKKPGVRDEQPLRKELTELHGHPENPLAMDAAVVRAKTVGGVSTSPTLSQNPSRFASG
jgi:hypothetical protein